MRTKKSPLARSVARSTFLVWCLCVASFFHRVGGLPASTMYRPIAARDGHTTSSVSTTASTTASMTASATASASPTANATANTKKDADSASKTPLIVCLIAQPPHTNFTKPICRRSSSLSWSAFSLQHYMYISAPIRISVGIVPVPHIPQPISPNPDGVHGTYDPCMAAWRGIKASTPPAIFTCKTHPTTHPLRAPNRRPHNAPRRFPPPQMVSIGTHRSEASSPSRPTIPLSTRPNG